MSLNLEQNKYVTIKYIYNYAKSLCHSTEANFPIYPGQWKSLTKLEKKEMVNRLNDKSTDWFNIKGILHRRGNVQDISKVQSNVTLYIRNNLAHITIIVLSNSGLLSEFIPDKQLTDYKLLPQNSTKERNDKIRELTYNTVINGPNKENYKKSIYFIDTLPYNNHVMDNNVTYLDSITSSSGNWITLHAMDWISQINTFHRYLNNRVIYVTGSTGVGKSVLVPRLLLYALKMCDFKLDALIGCTAPRINAVTSNTNTIATQMGIPQKYNIQFKYRGDQWPKDQSKFDQFGLKLRILTDGILDTEMNNQQLLKTISSEDSKDKKFTAKNKYDIVIIDEAHEHNTNMDLILTKMRLACYYNNDIKLIIMSATMDEDESCYRRYYRMINDNKMYPLSKYIEENKLDRINVDRRLHISAPGQTTQYTIEEFYPPYNFKTSDHMPEQIVIKILNETKIDDGDILLFQPGEGEIKQSVKYINDNTPLLTGVIAIPYFAKLNDEAKKFIEKIDENMNKFYFSKQEAETLKNIPFTVGTNIYKRVIIVATGIAEASITINSLRYVVDTNLQKINTFKSIARTETLDKKNISESSRIQRKGRLGRVAPGKVYYTYEKKTRTFIKRPYGIAISNIRDNLFAMLCNSQPTSKDKPLFNKDNDPNIHYKPNEYLYGLEDIVNNQYLVGPRTFDGKSTNYYAYYGNNKHYDYDFDRRNINHMLPTCYIDSYTYNTLFDYYGTFYIIHPDELCIERNILGNFIKCDETCGKLENKKFISFKINIFFSMLRENLFIVEDNKKNVYKTKFGLLINDLDVFNDINHTLAYVYSIKYECSEQMLKLLSIIISDMTISDIIYKGKYDEFTALYGNKSGDFVTVLTIMTFVDTWYINAYKKLGLVEQVNVGENVKSEWIEQKQLFFKDKTLVNSKYEKTLNDLYLQGKLSNTSTITNDEMKQLKLYDINSNNMNTVNNNKQFMDQLKYLCDNKYVDYDKVNTLYKIYKSLVYDLGYIVKSKLNEINKLTPELMQNYDKYNIEDRIKFCLIQAFPNNILKRIVSSGNDHFFVNLMYPSINNIYQIKKLTKFKNISDTSVKDVSSVILYIKKNTDLETDKESVVFIENVTYDFIAKLLPLDILHKKNVPTNYKEEIERYIKTIMNDENINKYDIVNNYANVLNDADNKLINSFDQNSLKYLVSIAGFDKSSANYYNVKRSIGTNEESDLVMVGGYNNYSHISIGANYDFAKYLLKL